MNSVNNIMVSAHNLGKMYTLYDKPQDRLKASLFGRLGKTYGHPFWALQEVSFEVRRGEWFGVIGMNGSGKSTLLQIIAGILQPTTGEVKTNGRIAALLELGSGFNPEYTGRENIRINAAILGLSSAEIEDRMDEIIAFADIGEFIDQPVKLYSSGMFVRLAFSVSTCVDADILIVDEALSVGDIFFTQKCFRRLEELRNKGVSIILVTHDIGLVEQYCERALLLNHGSPMFLGSAPETVKRYYLVEQQGRLLVESASPPAIQKTTETPSLVGDEFLPPQNALLDISNVSQISNGWGRCISVALCNENHEPCHVFEQGQIAVFFYEFEILQDIEVPIGGLQIMNDKGIVVHGKTTLEYGSDAPVRVGAGLRVRFRHKVVLSIAPGEYTFEVGFAAIQQTLFEKKDKMSFQDLYANVIRVCTLTGMGPFSVIFRKQYKPTQLLHHGLADLPGGCQISILSLENVMG
jgi:ABC-type polysaccharide/polyol phosphate transport system ATPase subunit